MQLFSSTSCAFPINLKHVLYASGCQGWKILVHNFMQTPTFCHSYFNGLNLDSWLQHTSSSEYTSDIEIRQVVKQWRVCNEKAELHTTYRSQKMHEYFSLLLLLPSSSVSDLKWSELETGISWKCCKLMLNAVDGLSWLCLASWKNTFWRWQDQIRRFYELGWLSCRELC